MPKYKFLSVIAEPNGYDQMTTMVNEEKKLGWSEVGTRAYETCEGVKRIYQAMVKPCVH